MMKILIVEDEKAISNFIRAGLESEGYACGQVFDGLAACDEIDENNYDLILLDVMLPGADGFEIMEYIRPKEIPVIFINRELGTSKMSGGIFSEAMFGVMRLRWDGWFKKYPKPIDK